MAWGKKPTAAAENKPKRHRRTKLEMQIARGEMATPEPVVYDDYTRDAVLKKVARIPEEKDTPTTESFKAEMKYRKLKSTKGWKEETLIILLEEWIARNELWPLVLKNFNTKR